MEALARGVRLEVHPPPDYVSDHIRRTGDFYEAAILDEVALRLDEPGGVIVDVGAMIGNHTVYLAELVPHSKIHAFEPFALNRGLLERNVARYPTVTVHPEALSDRPGLLRLGAPDPGNWGHVVAGHGGAVAEARTLDSFFLEDVTLVKIDVEGHEPEVIAGARDTIRRCRPLIVLEDWTAEYGALLPGYRVARSWQHEHQTYLYEPI